MVGRNKLASDECRADSGALIRPSDFEFLSAATALGRPAGYFTPLIKTGGLARANARSFDNLLKPLKRLATRSTSVHRAEAAVLMRTCWRVYKKYPGQATLARSEFWPLPEHRPAWKRLCRRHGHCPDGRRPSLQREEQWFG